MGEKTVLFVRGLKESDIDTSNTEDDIWDDTELRTAYDNSVSLAKQKLSQKFLKKEMNIDNGTSSSNISKVKKEKPRKKWKVGDSCRAVYSKDGEEYEAVIQSINQSGYASVRYIGYDNEEEVLLSALKSSKGYSSVNKQRLEALEYDDDTGQSEDNETDADKYGRSCPAHPRRTRVNDSSHETNSHQGQFHYNIPDMVPNFNIPMPPPPPPHFLSQFPDQDSEALSAMLLSWYMSGFHTGYYQGSKEARAAMKRNYKK